jgi:hypothetical protein
MGDDGLDRMWGDAPSRESTGRRPAHDDEEASAGEESAGPAERNHENQTAGTSDKRARSLEKAGDREERQSPSGLTDSGKRNRGVEEAEARDLQEAGPPDKEEIETRKRQFVIRADQDRALNRALAGENCSYGDDRSEIIQALLDLHGFCD